MWAVNGQMIAMTEGDWGIELPITISGTTFTAQDEVLFTLKKRQNGEVLLEKTFSDISNNTIKLKFTEVESKLLAEGSYVYSLDWYQNGVFLCNVIPSGMLQVVDKA